MSILKKYNPGGSLDSNPNNLMYNPERLQSWVSDQHHKFRGRKENAPEAQEVIKDYWRNIGYDPETSSIFGDDKSRFYETPWSAATVSNLVLALTGKDKESLKNFKVATRHSDYITDAFKSAADKDYQYNLYKPVRMSESDEEGNTTFSQFGVGDILFRGRSATKDWTYEEFEDAANNDRNYASHTDMITGKGKDDKGSYYEITGGNLGDTFKTSKVYYDPDTGEMIDSNYKGGMKFSLMQKEATDPENKINRVESRKSAPIETKTVDKLDTRGTIPSLLYNPKVTKNYGINM